jgi:hypothetical protein
LLQKTAPSAALNVGKLVGNEIQSAESPGFPIVMAEGKGPSSFLGKPLDLLIEAI